MKFIGFEREDEAIEWAKSKIGLEGPSGFCRAMASVDDNNNFLFVTVFSNFSSRNIDIHNAIEHSNKLTPRGFIEMWNEAMHYCFTKLGAARVTGLVRSSNNKARQFDERIGFKLEGVMREAFEDDDLCVYGFLRKDFEEHRWYHGR